MLSLSSSHSRIFVTWYDIYGEKLSKTTYTQEVDLPRMRDIFLILFCCTHWKKEEKEESATHKIYQRGIVCVLKREKYHFIFRLSAHREKKERKVS